MTNANPSPRLPLDVDVDEDNQQFILCPGEAENGSRCNATIYLSRKAKDNPLACPQCGQPLKIFAPDGRTPLNQHLVLLDTPLALIIADKFKQVAFPSVAVADKWRKFERDLQKPNSPLKPERVLEAADECLKKCGEHFGSACWSWIIARCANKTARESVKLPAPQTSHRQLMVE